MKTKALFLIAMAIVVLGISSITLAATTTDTYQEVLQAQAFSNLTKKVVPFGSVLQPILTDIKISQGGVNIYAAYVDQYGILRIAYAQKDDGTLLFSNYKASDREIPYYATGYLSGDIWTGNDAGTWIAQAKALGGKEFLFGVAPSGVNSVAEFVEKFYGGWIAFEDASSVVTPSQDTHSVPIVIIDDFTAAIPTTDTTATITGIIEDNGGYSITAKGVCYDTKIDYEADGTKIFPNLEGHGTCKSGGDMIDNAGRFTTTLNGLLPNTRYYARAYASNRLGTNYSQDVWFNTGAAVPGTSTTAFRATINTVVVAQNVAYVNYTVTADGSDLPVLSRGVCFGTAANPATICTPDATGGTGTFTAVNTAAVNSSVDPPTTGFPLTAGATYHARAYAVNSNGIVYSDDRAFNTLASTIASIDAPTASKSSSTIGGVATTTAVIKATVTSVGSSAITARGICYSGGAIALADVPAGRTTGSPVVCIADTTLNATNQLSPFYITLTNPPVPANTYNVVAYATNNAGTSVSAEMLPDLVMP